ncbi:MAG TPA: hypothetical protein VIH06_00540, partial [Ilumatobacteraceae bacterium]
MTLPTSSSLTELAEAALRACGAPGLVAAGELAARTPVTGATLGGITATTSVDEAVDRAGSAFQVWRTTPGPL